MKTFLLRLLKREHLVALVLVVAAVLSIFEVPQSFGVSEIKIVLILIGFLAVDSLIEKIGYFEGIEKNLTKIDNVVFPHPNSVVLQSRDTLPPFLEQIMKVRSVFIFAVSANALVMQHSRNIEEALKRGVNFRFVLVAPDNPAITAISASSPTSSDTETQVNWINHTVSMLQQMKKKKPKARLGLRLFHGLPTQSVVAYDLENENGYIQVEQHVYRQTPASRPVLILKAGVNHEWFKFYKNVIEEIWNDSTEIPL